MIDPKDAPEGYYATQPAFAMCCRGCDLYDIDSYCSERSTGYNCISIGRGDDEDVIFKLLENK